MFTRRNCDVHSCVAHTQLYHTQWVERTATPRLRGESRHLQWWAEIKALLWGLPLAWSKGPGCCSLCCYGATVLLFFLAVSLRDRGSKLVTVSFRLQSRAFSSCWGEGGGGGFPAVERKNPPPSLLMVYRLQRATRTLVEVVIFHTSFPVRERSAEPHTFPLPLPLSSISDVSHLFLQVVL